MRVTTLIAIGLSALITAAGAGAAPRAAHTVQYRFLGQLTTAPSNGQVAVTVQRGNPAALRAMLGQPVSQTFTYGPKTEFLKWSHGVPTVVQVEDLAAGDFVWINIRDTSGASLAQLEQKAAGMISDQGSQLDTPKRPLYLFRGTLTGTGPSSVTLDVQGGNYNATHLLIGRPGSQTFTVGAGTIFLLWQGNVPTVISLDQLKTGDPISIRVRAGRHATLRQVESTPAVHVGDHEPFVPTSRYRFLGRLTATPANGQLPVTVQRGNHPALHAMLGQPVSQTFAYGPKTEFLKWSQGVPTVVQAGDLAAGDFIWINIRAAANATLAQLEQRAAGLVGDHGSQLNPPKRPLYLFRGTLTATGANTVTLDVHGGNRRATRLLIGQPRSETFTVDGDTIFLLWQGKVPTVISLGQLKIGDSTTIRIRARNHASLAQVESTAAVHVGDLEPAGS